METTTIWWLLSGSLMAFELITGTFYLLMLAVGMVAGAIAAHLGFSTGTQMVTASILSSCAVGAWHWLGQRKKIERLESNQDVHLDVGSTVEVSAWSALGTTAVMHRGASWSAKHSQYGLADSSLFKTGWHRIVAVDGNTLVLAQI